MADVEKDGPSSSPQQNISGENTLTSSRKNLLRQLPTSPNTSPNLDTNGALFGDQVPDSIVTLAIIRNDFQATAMPNATPESLKKITTNKALIEAVNNSFLKTYDTGRN
ncbi:hypothetical protein RhiirA5_442764 [Rhizophagus irregularis]|uniref:Uncharacterized protein n=1 Tax=Rhizophagus irregularis TaxID=588596 RepID=A0A2N0NEG5_9GLOM|nr:hypothetical protein RhiirA5_442764 [Rhizophagus irregularis]